jgi:hypothetical protein
MLEAINILRGEGRRTLGCCIDCSEPALGTLRTERSVQWLQISDFTVVNTRVVQDFVCHSVFVFKCNRTF